MHATEALLSRARNYHLYGLAHHVQRSPFSPSLLSLILLFLILFFLLRFLSFSYAVVNYALPSLFLFSFTYHCNNNSERETTPQKWWGVALRCLEDAKIKIPPPETLKRVNSHEAFIFLDIGYLNFTNKRNKHALLAYKSSLETYATAQVLKKWENKKEKETKKGKMEGEKKMKGRN